MVDVDENVGRTHKHWHWQLKLVVEKIKKSLFQVVTGAQSEWIEGPGDCCPDFPGYDGSKRREGEGGNKLIKRWRCCWCYFIPCARPLSRGRGRVVMAGLWGDTCRSCGNHSMRMQSSSRTHSRHKFHSLPLPRESKRLGAELTGAEDEWGALVLMLMHWLAIIPTASHRDKKGSLLAERDLVVDRFRWCQREYWWRYSPARVLAVPSHCYGRASVPLNCCRTAAVVLLLLLLYKEWWWW